MKLGNRILATVAGAPAVRRAVALLAETGGPRMALGALGLLGLRGRVSRARRALERVAVAPWLPTGGKVLLIGVKSYNYHYIAFYRSRNEVTVVEPFVPLAMPAGVRLVRERLETWGGEAEAFDLVNFFGVYGWGLDTRPELEAAARVVSASAAPGGRLIFGFNRDNDPLGLAAGNGVQALFPDFAFDPVLKLDDGVFVHVGRKSGARSAGAPASATLATA